MWYYGRKKTIYGQLFKEAELTVKAGHLRSIKTKTNWYWKPEEIPQNLLVSTQTLVHPCIYISVVIDVANIPSSVVNRNQARRSIPRR